MSKVKVRLDFDDQGFASLRVNGTLLCKATPMEYERANKVWLMDDLEFIDRIQNICEGTIKKQIYLAGKVSGLTPEEYHKKFEDCREWLRWKLGPLVKVVIPMDICEDDWDWLKCMEVCVPELKASAEVYLMPDWKGSKGAVSERYIAEAAGIPIYEIYNDDQGFYKGFVKLDEKNNNSEDISFVNII